MQEVQEEIQKLKELYESSSKALEKWPQSDAISSCDDKDFMGLLQNINEVDLEAAVYGLQRQLEIEVQLVKCLEQLREINSESIDATSKLITSQERVARLRSRLLRCVNKQLINHGNDAVLPPWHGPLHNDNKESSLVSKPTNTTMEDDRTENIIAPFSNNDKQPISCSDNNVNEKDSKRPDSELSQMGDPNGELNWVEAKELSSSPPIKDQEQSTDSGSEQSDPQLEDDVGKSETDTDENGESAVKVLNVRDSLMEDGGLKKLQDTLEKNLYDKGHDSKVVQASAFKIPPPKPAPYSALETMPMLDMVKSTNSAEVMAAGEDESDGIVIKEQILIQDWDPTKLLEDLFGECSKDKEAQPESPTDGAPASMSIVRMSGYMDKLPSSYKQKKSSVFKGWRKRHFKAFDGKLFYFEGHRNHEPLGMVDLKGSSVVISSGKVLEINDSEGTPVLKLRCASQAEAEDWKQALEAEAKEQQDPVYEEVRAAKGSVIVIDLGSSAVRAGFAKEEAWPEVMFPCVCSVLKEDDSDCVYGFAALKPKRRKTSSLRFPLRRSLKIDKLKFSPMDLTGILEHTFHLLKVDPSQHKVVMTIPQNTNQDDKGALVEILLGFFNVEACYLQEQAILAMYSYSAVSGVIVDVGDHIDVIPVVEGCVIESGASRLPYGGRQVTDMLARLLTEKGHRFFSEVESFVTRYIKEQCSYVSEIEICSEQEMPSYSTDVMLDKYQIPDGTRQVTVDTARYRCTEGLFDPMVWGKDHDGIAILVYKAIMSCSMDVRRQMARSVYLSGGGTMSPGFPERLHREVTSKLPPHTIVQVHAGTDRHHAAFIGASVVARLPLFEELCITQEEWNDSGIEALEKWNNI